MPVGGRVAGKVGIYSSHYNGNVDVDIVLLGIYDDYVSTKAIFVVNGDILRACKFIMRIPYINVNEVQKLLRYDYGPK